jgi:predicted glycoside hydrolase/deacetylase ChbG (UPF0249 family)
LRQLVVNADDFGFTRDTNDGIIAAHREGILTATTLMANGAAFDHAVELAHSHPTLDVGCHLVLVGGPGQPPSVSDLLVALTRGQLDPYRELRAQIEKIVAAGIAPRHLDTHKHTHLWPPVLKAVARLSQEFAIPWVRRPFDFPLTIRPVPWTRRLMSATLGGLRPWFHRVLSQHGCRTTDHFAGFEITGAFVADDLVKLIAALPEGSTEFMCHPGYLRDELRQARTRLKESREQELQALIHPSVREALTRHGVRLVGYRDL